VHFDNYLQVNTRGMLCMRRPQENRLVIASGENLGGSQPPGMIGGDSTAELLKQARSTTLSKRSCCVSTARRQRVRVRDHPSRDRAAQGGRQPVIASMSSTAASGGYYISMNADEIWASRNTLTGSIGVFAVLPTLERSLAKLGVHTDGHRHDVSVGRLQHRALADGGSRELLQLSIEHEYRQFIELVANARGKSPDDIDSIAQGPYGPVAMRKNASGG